MIHWFKSHFILLAVLAFALLVRLDGLQYGIGYHPDERGNVMHVMDLSWSDMNPHFFAYGSLPFYILFFLKELPALISSKWAAYHSLFIVGRLLSVIAGVGTVIVVFLIGKALYGRRTGLWAAFFLSVTVLHIQYSHFYAVDILLTFVMSLIFYQAMKIPLRATYGAYIAVGVLFGMGLATKISILPFLCVPLFFHLKAARKQQSLFRASFHVRFMVLLIVAAMVSLMCQPYALLDYQKFAHDIREQSNMVRGVSQPPYAIQYEHTTPYVYFISQMGKWAVGWPLVMAGILGLFIALWQCMKHGDIFSMEIIIPLWMLLYFAITGAFAVKFLRYMLPIFPFLALCAARFFTSAHRFFRERHLVRGFKLLLLFTAVYQIVYCLAFLTIYHRPHPWEAASRWIYEHIPPNKTLLVEHWDHALPVPLPDAHRRYQSLTLPLYERDTGGKVESLAKSLWRGDYIIIATKRLYGSICKVPQRYPISSRYYKKLLRKQLGYRLVKSFQSYPGLFGFSLVDDLADESFSVYDHPKVYLFQKIESLSVEQLKAILTDTRQPFTSSDYETIVRARTFDEVGYVPPLPDTSLPDLLRFWCWSFVLTLLMFPLVYRVISNVSSAYPLARLFSTVVPVYLLWSSVSLRLIELNQNGFFLMLLILLIFSLSQLQHLCRNVKKEQLVSTMVFYELCFNAVFIAFLLIRAFNPEIYWGEKPMDFSFLNSIYRTASFPPTDPWFSGKAMNYYYFSYLQAGLLGRFTGIQPAVMYNLFVAYIPALSFILLVALFRRFTSIKLTTVLGSLFVLFSSNIYQFIAILFQGRKLGFSTWWDSSRILTGNAIDEYPIWSFLFADLHAHMCTIPLGLALLVCLIHTVFHQSNIPTSNRSNNIMRLILLSFVFSLITVSNAWDALPYAMLAFTFFVVRGVHSPIITLKRNISSPTLKRLVNGVMSSILAAVVLGTSVLWTLFYHLSFKSQKLSYGINRADFSSFYHIFLHFGHFLALPVVTFFLLIYFRSDSSKQGLRGKVKALITPIRPKSTAIFLFLLLLGTVFCIALWQFWELRTFVTALFLMILCLVFAFRTAGKHLLQSGLILLSNGFAIIAFCELFHIMDRMNTIFKFYYSAWFFIGLGTLSLCGDLVKSWAFTLPSSPTRRLSSLFSGGNYLSRLVSVLLMVILMVPPLFGTICGIITVLGVHRVPDFRPTLDGRRYLLSHAPEDYATTNFLNQKIRGPAVIAEAHGPAYQEYTRVSMHTGLNSVLGWEHHVYQRGAARSDIRQRELDLKDLFTTTDRARAEQIIEQYAIELIYFGALERKAYKVNQLPLADMPGLLSILYTFGKTTVYSVNSPGTASAEYAANRSIKVGPWSREHTEVMLPPDWSREVLYEFGNAERAVRVQGMVELPTGHLLVTDAANQALYYLDPSGSVTQVRFPSELRLSNPGALLFDETQARLWLADRGNDRLLIFPIHEVTSQSHRISRASLIIIDSIPQPSGICIMKNYDKIFVTSAARNTLYVISPKTREVERIPLPGVKIASSVAAWASDSLCVLDMAQGTLFGIDLKDSYRCRKMPVDDLSLTRFENSFAVALNKDSLYVASQYDPYLYYVLGDSPAVRTPIGTNETTSMTAAYDLCLLLFDYVKQAVIKICPPQRASLWKASKGDLPGQFREPRSMALASDGSMFVADTGNHRIQKFSSKGRYLLQWGGKGDDEGQFNEPMGIAVDAQDRVFVADTWNHRIQVFTKNGQFLYAWSDSFYGPRDLCIQGTKVYVADTGNHLIKVYSLTGKRIKIYGNQLFGSVVFKEPIGLASDGDFLYVADSGNSRIVKIDLKTDETTFFPVDCCHTPSHREPYLALIDSRILAISDPTRDRILCYTIDGRKLSSISGTPKHHLSKPRGVTFNRKTKKLLVVDTWNHTISAIDLKSIPFPLFHRNSN